MCVGGGGGGMDEPIGFLLHHVINTSTKGDFYWYKLLVLHACYMYMYGRRSRCNKQVLKLDLHQEE